jgi:hypothetical protein
LSALGRIPDFRAQWRSLDRRNRTGAARQHREKNNVCSDGRS